MSTQPQPRSNFVTVVAACFSIFNAFAMVLTVVQMVVATGAIGFDIPPWFMVFAFALFVLFALDLRGSVGLYRRRAWARRYFIRFRIFNLVTMAMGLAAIIVMAIAFRVGPAELILQGIIVLIWVPFALFFVKIIRVLRSPAIVAEFEA